MAGGFKIADPNIGAVLVDNTGRQTPYYQRFLQEQNRQLRSAIADLTAITAALSAQLALIEAQQVQLDATIETLNYYVAVFRDFFDALDGTADVTTTTPDGSGDIVIPHGWDRTPVLSRCTALPTGTSYFTVQMTSVDATNLNCRLFDAVGLPITTGSWPVAWRVTLGPLIYPPGP